MTKDAPQDIDKLMIDVILDKPITFTLGKKYFYLMQPSFGLVLIISDLYKRLEFDEKFLAVGQTYEMLRVCTEYRDTVLRIIALHTFLNRADALCEEKVVKRMKELKELDAADLSAMLLEVLRWSTYQEQFIKHIGLDKEKQRRERIQSVKKDKNSITFGGRSIYGSLFDHAAERYGWTLQYMLWGISAINLQMMLQDSVQSIYLTDEDRKKADISTDGVYINADDKNSKEEIKRYLRSRNKKK